MDYGTHVCEERITLNRTELFGQPKCCAPEPKPTAPLPLYPSAFGTHDACMRYLHLKCSSRLTLTERRERMHRLRPPTDETAARCPNRATQGFGIHFKKF